MINLTSSTRGLVLALTVLLCVLDVFLVVDSVSLDYKTKVPQDDGPANYAEGERLFAKRDYDRAAMHYWRAVILQKQSEDEYSVESVFNSFMQCFVLQDRVADGFVYIAQESFGRGQTDMAKMYLTQALVVDPNHEDGNDLKEHMESMGLELDLDIGPGGGSTSKIKRDFDDDDEDDDEEEEEEESDDLDGTPEELYEVGSKYFQERDYEDCADTFEISCHNSNFRLSPSCANAVYCRTMIIDWGFNGTQFAEDMKRIIQIAESESTQFRKTTKDGSFAWSRSMSTHPHMMLGYPADPVLKRYVAESAAFMEDMSQRVTKYGTIKPLPDDLPFDPQEDRSSFIFDAAEADFKIRIGFVASGINSKAVMFLSHDMFRFFNKRDFEVHVFSLGPPDSPLFIQHGMRGVDWRERVKSNADFFHDVQQYKSDHIGLARYIHERKIHILLEWDGYARQGERAQGLFALHPAPVQIWHQEYLGTSGGQYVDYLFTDKVASPPHLQHLYVEKLIYLPNHFFSKGHAVQSEVREPTLNFTKKQDAYRPGTGSPQTNRCLAPANKGPKTPSIVFCNFNKFLKNNPETVRSWIRILREVPDSMLCLLENPPTGVTYLRRFIHEAAGTSKNNRDEASFVPGDGDDLNSRIHFLPWERNPFDHQMRNHDFCNVMLDSYPYNGHTTAQDALYGGVPIVTRSDGDDMASRVSTSANIVLGLEELNAYDGPRQYEEIAIELGNNREKFKAVREKLIGTCNQRNPMHPYWDVPRYVRNFETALKTVWERYLSGKPPDHVTVEESEETKQGTYDDVLERHPPMSEKRKKKKKSRMDEL